MNIFWENKINYIPGLNTICNPPYTIFMLKAMNVGEERDENICSQRIGQPCERWFFDDLAKLIPIGWLNKQNATDTINKGDSNGYIHLSKDGIDINIHYMTLPIKIEKIGESFYGVFQVLGKNTCAAKTEAIRWRFWEKKGCLDSGREYVARLWHESDEFRFIRIGNENMNISRDNIGKYLPIKWLDADTYADSPKTTFPGSIKYTDTPSEVWTNIDGSIWGRWIDTTDKECKAYFDWDKIDDDKGCKSFN